MPQAADMINLGFLTDSERELILEVLRRDEELRQAEEQRIRKLKTELVDIRRKGAKRSSGRYSQRSCGRCLEPLSLLAVGSSQCRACKHQVCPTCRTVRPIGSWLCSVCDKEADLKKSTGDWFYDLRVNRFSASTGRDLVRASIRKRPPLRKRESVGEALLKSAEMKPSDPAPVARPRAKDRVANRKGPPSETSGSAGSRESVEMKTHVESRGQPARSDTESTRGQPARSDTESTRGQPARSDTESTKGQPTRSDTESTEKTSLCSTRTETESDRGTPDSGRKEKTKVQSSPTGSSVSIPAVASKADGISVHSPVSSTNTAPEVNRPSAGPQSNCLEVDGIFKKSVRRGPKPPEFTSALDLREEEGAVSQASMGNRSKSVPGLDAQVHEEEDEDIDNLVNIHKKTVDSSSSSLRRSSKSTLGSMMSIYSEAGDYDTVEVSGDVVFSLRYDEHTQSLDVFIKQCHGLAHGDASRHRSNPYVKCYLLPDKARQSKKKTSTKRNTVNPVYNEKLKYSISRSQLLTRSLLLSVWHHGRISRNAFLGEVEVSLDCRDLDSPEEMELALMGKAASSVQASAFAQYKGELVISLKYIAAKMPPADGTKGKKVKIEEGGELHVLIKEARSLTAMKAGGTSDSFVKGYLLPAKAKSTKRKTPVVKKNLNPHYDHTFIYKDQSLEQLSEMCLELTVWDREAMSSNDFLGGVRLSTGAGFLNIGKEDIELDSVGEEVSLWQKMMQYPDSWAEGTLPLRSSMGKSKGK